MIESKLLDFENRTRSMYLRLFISLKSAPLKLLQDNCRKKSNAMPLRGLNFHLTSEIQNANNVQQLKELSNVLSKPHGKTNNMVGICEHRRKNKGKLLHGCD